LVLEQLSTGRQWRFPGVTEFRFDKFGHNVSWVVDGEDTQRGVWWTSLTQPLHPQRVHDLEGKYAGLVLDEAGQQLAFSYQGVAEAFGMEYHDASKFVK
jgi:hypothetical protein